MQINVTLDPSVAGAPAGFVTAVDYVVALFESTFANPVTIDLDVGWGEVDGQKLDADALGESIGAGTNGFTFAQVRSALLGLAALGDTIPASGLPAADPTGGGIIDPGTAEARALGLMPAVSGQIDGWIGLSSIPNTFTFDPNNRAVPGLFDAIGTIEHELTEIMGRVAGLNPDYYSVLDLYRYSSPGAPDLTGSRFDYFSIDRGAHSLDAFNHDQSGDLGDWADSAGNDSFLAFTGPGANDAMTTADLKVMAAIGWIDVPTAAATAAFEAPAAGPLAAGQVVTIVLDMNEAVTVSGAPTLTLAGGPVATYSGGSGGHTLEFSYIVSADGTDPATLAPTAINLNGGSIDDSFANPANLSLNGVSTTDVDNIYVGSAGDTVLTGGTGNDVFFVGGGNDSVTGGAGLNTVVFTGPILQYGVSGSAAITVIDSVPARDGMDILHGVQQVKFADITLVFDLHSSQDTLVYELYQAAYARIPDLAGFRFWAGVADATNASGISLADAFLAAPEYTQKYGANPGNTDFVTELYTNVLDRQPDQAGLNYWVAQANAGEPRDQLLVAFAQSAENVQLISPHIAEGYWTA